MYLFVMKILFNLSLPVLIQMPYISVGMHL